MLHTTSKGLAFGWKNSKNGVCLQRLGIWLEKTCPEVHAAGDADTQHPQSNLLAARIKAAICIAGLWVISGHNIVKKLVGIPNRMEEWVNFLQH